MFADVTSANIVGYQQLDTETSGKAVMTVPTFLGVGNAEGCTLADLRVTGYPDAEWDEDMEETVPGTGCTGMQFGLQLLNANGTTKIGYFWIDDGNPAHPAGWYADGQCAPIAGGAASVKFTAGDGAWIFGSNLKLVPAGEVITKDVICKTLASGMAVAIGNATPVDLTLDELSVTGYPDAEWDEDMEETVPGTGCTGMQFGAQFLYPNGTTKVGYFWIDDGNPAHPAGWYADGQCAPIPDGPSSVDVPAGQGLWVFGSTFKLVVPGVEL